jgi:hypothetical protein
MTNKHLYTYDTFQDWTNDYRQVYVITSELLSANHELKDCKNLQHIGTGAKRIDDDKHQAEVTIEYINDKNVVTEQIKRHLFMDTTSQPFT